jgi:ubiquinone/menaquinone biosynthesis C-methylase UbiE
MDDYKPKIDPPSYNNETDDYRFGYSHDEIERLGHQHQVWAEDNRRFISRSGFSTGATLIDLGCGPGYTTFDLAKTVGPEGRIIAIDRDGERSLRLLKEEAEAAGLFNIETRTADLETFDLHESSVDGVYGRWVLMYLPENMVKPLICRMAKWLRPGGVCALMEICNYRHIHIHPRSTYLPEIAEALIRAVTGERGCNPEIGNDLPGLLHFAGLDVGINVVTKAVRATTPEWLWPDTLFRNHLPTLVEEGYLARGVFEAFFAEWEERSKEPDAIFFGSPMMEVVGKLG